MLKQFSIKGALLNYFIGSSLTCFHSGRSFRDIGKKANFSNILIEFCKTYEGHHFKVGQGITGCANITVEDDADPKWKSKMGLNFTEFPYGSENVNLTLEKCQAVMLSARDTCDDQGGDDITVWTYGDHSTRDQFIDAEDGDSPKYFSRRMDSGNLSTTTVVSWSVVNITGTPAAIMPPIATLTRFITSTVKAIESKTVAIVEIIGATETTTETTSIFTTITTTGRSPSSSSAFFSSLSSSGSSSTATSSRSPSPGITASSSTISCSGQLKAMESYVNSVLGGGVVCSPASKMNINFKGNAMVDPDDNACGYTTM